MSLARLNFDGDNVYTEKEGRIHKLTEEVEAAIDGIPAVENSLTSTSTTAALSANQGRLLKKAIDELKSVGRFLSTWDCTTGLPSTDPLDDPYTYKTGDYYIISAVADTSLGFNNYRPNGSVYTAGIASTAVETSTVSINDWYLYDGQSWVIQAASGATISIDSALSPTSINAVQNKVVYEALADKQDIISDLNTIRTGAALGATALQSGDNVSELANDANYATRGELASAIAGVVSDAGYSSSWNGVTTVAPSKNAVYDAIELKQNIIQAGDNITINGDTISATDTTYSQATASNLGLIKLGSDTVQSKAASTASSVNNRTYPIQVNSSGQAVVNVPWTDNNTTYTTATASTAGVVKLGSDTVQSNTANAVTSEAAKTYAIQKNGDDQLVVNVPWQNTTYGTATASTAGVVKLGNSTVQTTTANSATSTANRTYPIQVNSSGQAVVNVPWTETNVKAFTIASYTDYTNATSAYEWYAAGNVPVLTYLNQAFELYSWNVGSTSDSGVLTFARSYIANSILYQHLILITITNGEATAIAGTTTSISSIFATEIQAGTSTDAKLVTAANLAYGLVRISSESNGIKTQIRTGTQTQYDALSSKDSNTLYFVTSS